MSSTPSNSAAGPASRRQLRAFLCTNFLYVWLVFGWSLTLYPLGIDFAYLAGDATMNEASRRVFAMLQLVAGGDIWPFRVFNILLLYACMVCVLLLTRFALDGPWWLGSFAAVMMMANPVKSEAVLQLSAVADLLPAFLALAALTAFAAWHRHRGLWLYLIALILGAFGTLAFIENVALPLVMMALYILIPTGRMARTTQLMPFLLLGGAGMIQVTAQAWTHGFNPVDRFAPILWAFYPLGLRTETAILYERFPEMWFLPMAALCIFAYLGWRMSRQPAIFFALAGALLFRLAPAGTFDFVHLRGGGGMLLPFACLYIGFASIWMSIQRHPRWRRAAVTLTTVLCVVFMALQIQALWHWRQAAAVVKSFQARAKLSVEASAGEPVAILPDYRYHHSAPIGAYASVAYDTAHSEALPVRSALAMHYFRHGRGGVRILDWTPLGADVEITGCSFEELFGADLYGVRAGDDVTYENYQLKLISESDGKVVVRIYPLDEFLPERIITLGNAGDPVALRLGEAMP
ncbi:MAG: hypothetical protein RLZZ303_3252 [Candidatus Hydrogenedentota bacterium]|jgi:hypothetical protein